MMNDFQPIGLDHQVFRSISNECKWGATVGIIGLMLLFAGCGYDPVYVDDGSEPTPSRQTPPQVVRMSDEAFRSAAQQGQADKVRQAIAGGVDLNAASSSDGMTALHLAAHDGRMHVAKLLIDKGAEIDLRDGQGHTPLLMAAYNGHASLVRMLHERGAQIDARDAQGMTPLIHACSGPHHETVEYLVKSGAEINAVDNGEGFTPLMTAAALGERDVVAVLLKHGADKSIQDGDGDTALSHAQSSGKVEIVELLKD